MSPEIAKRIIEEFPSDNQAHVKSQLEMYSDNYPERDRVHRAILDLASGNPKKVETLVAEAVTDYQDVLSSERSPSEKSQAKIFIGLGVVFFIVWQEIEFFSKHAT